MEVKLPIIYGEVAELATDVRDGHKANFNVYIASAKEDELPIYMCMNRDTKVVEFFNENLFFVKEWLAHFVVLADETGPAESLDNLLKLQTN